MTCIVGLVQDGKVYIGGDSAGIRSNYDLTVRGDRKVFRNGEFVMGFTSSFRMGQILAFAMTPPKPHEGDDLFGFMVRDFVGAARQAMRDGGFARNTNGEETGGEFLVGYRGRLFLIGGDFQVAENVQPYSACGCGAQIALGSIFSTPHITDPQARVIEALQAAETFSAGVRSPFHVEVA